jgi:hypothetical protein
MAVRNRPFAVPGEDEDIKSIAGTGMAGIAVFDDYLTTRLTLKGVPSDREHSRSLSQGPHASHVQASGRGKRGGPYRGV